MSKIVIPLNSFRQSEISLDEYETFFQVIEQSRAFGVELRRELLTPSISLLERVQKILKKYELFTIYSAPVYVWQEDGTLNQRELETIFEEANTLKANWLKVSLGHFKNGHSDLNGLKKFLGSQSKQLLVENDQTTYGGQITPLKQFFDQVSRERLNIKMTFDIGNWHYTNQDPVEALNIFSSHIMYMHLKKVVLENGALKTVPLSMDDPSNWRQFVNAFSKDLVKALEFPIHPIQKTKSYVDLLLEREEEYV